MMGIQIEELHLASFIHGLRQKIYDADLQERMEGSALDDSIERHRTRHSSHRQVVNFKRCIDEKA